MGRAPLMGCRFAALLFLLGAAFGARPASACSMNEGYRTPTNFELIRQADLVVVARVVSGATDLNSRATWVNVEPVRVLKGSLPAEPLRVLGVLGIQGETLPSMPTPLGDSHFSAGMGACIRLFYPQGGLILAMFKREPEGMRPLWAAFGRATEDVEAVDGVWVRAAQAYVAIQQGVADGGLRAAVESRLPVLRAQTDDLFAQAVVRDLQYYLDETAPGVRVRSTARGWAWLDTPGVTGVLLPGPDGGTRIGLHCERGERVMHLDLFGGTGTPRLTLLAGGRRFEGEGEARMSLPDASGVTATIPFTPALAETLRTSPAPAGLEVAGSAPVTAPPGDVLQKFALRCAALLAPAAARG